jgi:hypothetical protein
VKRRGQQVKRKYLSHGKNLTKKTKQKTKFSQNQFKKLKETNFEKNGVFSKILFSKKGKDKIDKKKN